MSWSWRIRSRNARVALGAGGVAILLGLLVLFGISSRRSQVGTGMAVSFAPTSKLIGRSVEGRDIVATRFGDPGAPRTVAAIGVIHGNEQGGLPIVKQLEQTGAPSGTQMWIIPTVNPDGQLRHTRQNAHGVDLNRNTTDQWASSDRGLFYSGPRAESEPETRAYVGFLAGLKPDFVVIFHQHGNGVDNYRAKNPTVVAGLAADLGLPIKSFACTGVCRGTLTGWFNSQFPGSANTVELPAAVSSSLADKAAHAFLTESLRVPDYR